MKAFLKLIHALHTLLVPMPLHPFLDAVSHPRISPHGQFCKSVIGQHGAHPCGVTQQHDIHKQPQSALPPKRLTFLLKTSGKMLSSFRASLLILSLTSQHVYCLYSVFFFFSNAHFLLQGHITAGHVSLPVVLWTLFSSKTTQKPKTFLVNPHPLHFRII